MKRGERVLIVCDGGLASLLACAAAREAIVAMPDVGEAAALRPVVWLALGGEEEATARGASVEQHARIYGHELIDAGRVTGGGAGERESAVLVGASYAAARLACDSVLWPVHAGGESEPDLDVVSRAVDRALLVTRLVSLDAEEHPKASIRIDTPYVDFTDMQLAELAVDLALPVQTCWWWRPGPEDLRSLSAGGVKQAVREHTAAVERQRWQPLLASAGWSAPTLL